MPENPPANQVTEPQLNYLRKLARQVTGDGDAHLAAFKAFHSQAVTTTAASAEIKRLKTLLAAGDKAPAPAKRDATTTNAPAGRYAVDLPGEAGSMLVEVTKPASGRWAGYTFVKTVPLLAEIAPEPVKGPLAVAVLKAIEANPRGCVGMYGRITGKCGLCNRRLADPNSKILGIGPECMMKLGHMDSTQYETPMRRVTGAQPPERF